MGKKKSRRSLVNRVKRGMAVMKKNANERNSKGGKDDSLCSSSPMRTYSSFDEEHNSKGGKDYSPCSSSPMPTDSSFEEEHNSKGGKDYSPCSSSPMPTDSSFEEEHNSKEGRDDGSCLPCPTRIESSFEEDCNAKILDDGSLYSIFPMQIESLFVEDLSANISDNDDDDSTSFLYLRQETVRKFNRQLYHKVRLKKNQVRFWELNFSKLEKKYPQVDRNTYEFHYKRYRRAMDEISMEKSRVVLWYHLIDTYYGKPSEEILALLEKCDNDKLDDKFVLRYHRRTVKLIIKAYMESYVDNQVSERPSKDEVLKELRKSEEKEMLDILRWLDPMFVTAEFLGAVEAHINLQII